MRRLTVGSLFAGIGGFDLGFERAGFEIKWQVEIDQFCRRVLEKHWPHVRRYEDVRTVGAELESVDVIVGGFPCQPVSLAGKRAAQADERWLWPEFARIVRDLRPRYVVVENVPGLLTAGMGTVVGGLAAIGYDAEWKGIPAAAVGAPHLRWRVWIVAYPQPAERRSHVAGRHVENGRHPGRQEASGRPESRGEALAHANSGRQQERAELNSAAEQDPTDRDSRGQHVDGRRDDVADAVRERLPLTRHGGSVGSGSPRIFTGATLDGDCWWATEPDVGRVAHGIPARVDRLRGLGNAIVPQIAQWIATRILEAEGLSVVSPPAAQSVKE